MLLSSWTTVDLVEKWVSEGEEYARREEVCWTARGVYEDLARRRARVVRGRAEEATARDTARAAAGPSADMFASSHAAADRDF